MIMGQPHFLLREAILALMLASSACGRTFTKPPSIDTIDGMSSCSVVRDPLNPWVIEWRAAELTSLQAKLNKGVVIVSYAPGCTTLKMLSGCHAEGSYGYEPSTPPNLEHLTIDTKEKLYAELPIGAVSLEAHVRTGTKLQLDYVSVGVRNVSGEPGALSGECEGASHYVRSVIVGAYKLDAVANEDVGAGLKAPANIAVEGGHDGTSKSVKASGNVDHCIKNPISDECRAILQLGLASLPAAANKPASVASDVAAGPAKKFTVDIAPIEVAAIDMPSLGELPSFQTADVAALKALQLAKRADRNRVLTPYEKSLAWGLVADHQGASKDLQQLGRRRRDEWLKAHAVDDKLEALFQSRKTDLFKLRELIALDEDVLSRQQKNAYARQFLDVYAPFEDALISWLVRKRVWQDKVCKSGQCKKAEGRFSEHPYASWLDRTGIWRDKACKNGRMEPDYPGECKKVEGGVEE